MLVFVRSSVDNTFAESIVLGRLDLLAQFTLMSESYSDSSFAGAETSDSSSTLAAVVKLTANDDCS